MSISLRLEKVLSPAARRVNRIERIRKGDEGFEGKTGPLQDDWMTIIND